MLIICPLWLILRTAMITHLKVTSVPISGEISLLNKKILICTYLHSASSYRYTYCIIMVYHKRSSLFMHFWAGV